MTLHQTVEAGRQGPPYAASRRAGILVPLFSLSSSRGWGIGEIGDIAAMTQWLAAAGHRVLQLLPINEMPAGETSPYSSLSAMAIDPQFITMADVEDFAATGGEAALMPEDRELLDAARTSARVEYAVIRPLKHAALRRCFSHFRASEWGRGTRRSTDLRRYIEEEAWWLDDYALFRALYTYHAEMSWTGWPMPLRGREPQAIADARARLGGEILFRQYIQWIADQQWRAARERAGRVALLGDLPFMVGGNSADVWSRQDEFRMDVSVGVAPDAFSDTGQDWGLPAYRWDLVAERGFEWLHHRARRNADLYDGYRVDHLVGFYRTYYRPHDQGEPAFTPVLEHDQIALGERVLATLGEAGAEIIAEDLGIVPEFVRQSLGRLGVPGYKVFRWEREWTATGLPFHDPASYPPVSVATSGTHDTEPMVTWWQQAPDEEREAVLATPSVRAHLSGEDVNAARAAPAITDAVRDALLASLCASGSNLVVFPIQDVFGWPDRINVPATVGDANWTWRLPWPVETMAEQPVAKERLICLRTWCTDSGR